jgi:hypothetical protein
MSHRSSIKEAIISQLLVEMDGQQKPGNPRLVPPYPEGTPLFDVYLTDIEGEVSGNNLHFQDIEGYPHITVTLGSESVEYQPSGFRWNFLTLFIRAYVKSEDAAEERLEEIIQDIKTFVDRNEVIPYTITKPDGTTQDLQATEMTIEQITTDEGLLRPLGIGEVSISVRYADRNGRLPR